MNKTILTAGLLGLLITGCSTTKPALERIAVMPSGGPGGKLGHIDVSEKNQMLFMGNKMNKTLDVFDLKKRKCVQQLPEQQGCSGISYSPIGDHPIVGKGNMFCTFKFDGEKYVPAKNLEGKGCSKVSYSFYDHNFYGQKKVDNGAYLTVFDSKTLEHLHDIKVPDGHYTNLAMSQDKPRMYMSGKGKIIVIDTDKKEVINTFPITKAKVNKAAVVDDQNERLLIVCRQPPTLIAMDANTGEEIATVPIKGDMDDLTFDAKRRRAYIPCGKGSICVVQQLDADHYELLEEIPTGLRTRTDFYSPGLDLYFVSAERKDDMTAPEVWIYQPH